MDLNKNTSFISRFMVSKHLLDCAAFALSFQTKMEVSRSFKMLSHKEKVLVFLLLLVSCLLSGTPLNWSERQWSGVFGVMDKDRRTEISENMKREDETTRRPVNKTLSALAFLRHRFSENSEETFMVL